MKRNAVLLSRFVISVSLVFSAAPIVAGSPPSFQGVGDLFGDSFWSDAYAVSADGTTVVGRSRSNSGWEAFRWRNGVIVGLGDLPGDSFFSEAHGVSADGAVIVGFGQANAGRRAFRWEAGAMHDLGNLSSNGESSAWGVSADGAVVVGQGSSPSGGEAFRWSNGIMSGLGDLPGGIQQSNAMSLSANGEVIVGWGYTDVHKEGFRWSNGILTGLGSLAGPDYASEACAVSANGNVIVGMSTSGLGNTAFRWENGEMISLGALPGGYTSYGLAVSADGNIIVGESYTVSGLEPATIEATIWDKDHGLRSLRSVLADDFGLSLDGWALERATGISADGLTIVGQGRNPNGQTEGWIAILPEPSTALLLALGGPLILGRPHRATGQRRPGSWFHGILVRVVVTGLLTEI